MPGYRSGRRVVFYVPPLPGPIRLQCQMREGPEYEMEERVVEEVEEEEPAEGAARKKRKVAKTIVHN